MDNTKKAPRNKAALFAAIWLVTYTICLFTIKKLSPGASTGIILSLLPVVTFALFIYTLIRGVASMDEVQIRIQMEAAVIAFSLALLMIMTLGLLDLVITLNKEDWGYRHVVPYFAIFYFIGLIISKRKYD
ncbi:MAG: hypothetical protein H7Z13_06975 [Ferruginibacter sp.]|nr:hypothetical protein [Ferruginibacter sp.]